MEVTFFMQLPPRRYGDEEASPSQISLLKI